MKLSPTRGKASLLLKAWLLLSGFVLHAIRFDEVKVETRVGRFPSVGGRFSFAG